MSNFRSEMADRVAEMQSDKKLSCSAEEFLYRSALRRYSYNFHWLGRPIIQYPTDVMAMQELIWEVKPDLIVECGIAHGGSLIFSASMLGLIDMCEAIEAGEIFDPATSRRRVLGIDIDIRSHNRESIDAHPMRSRINMIEGSSTVSDVIAEVYRVASTHKKVLVCLDSNHTRDHVFAELEAYAPLVSIGSYCVVFDTVIEDMGPEAYPGRPWGPGNSPKTAVHAYLQSHPEFEIDKSIPDRLMITVAHDGWLKRTR